ncbi:MAG: hypothetical protein RSA20_10045, partial [Oscillospiraceae bacterium]
SQLVAVVTVVVSIALIIYMRYRTKKTADKVTVLDNLSGEDLKAADCIAKAIEKNKIQADEIIGAQDSDAAQQEEPPKDVSE